MSEFEHIITGAILERQHRAADPGNSAWVSANAGAGKTHILTERVLRLLLCGVAPEQILCLTYTKAAAAEMRTRVSSRLAAWTLMSGKDLRDTLDKLSPLAKSPADADKDALERARTQFARTLFAHALETPGGLKINTVHAFCESVLHRFALEAGVPVDFTVVEEAGQTELIAAAREEVLAGAINGDPGLACAVATLFALMGDKSIEDAIKSALAQNRRLRPVLADPAAAKARLRTLIGAVPGQTVETVERDMVRGSLLTPDDYAKVFAISAPKPGGTRFEDKLAAIDPGAPTAQGLLTAFLRADLGLRASFPKKDFKTADPELAELLGLEAARLFDLVTAHRRAAMRARSEALIDVLAAIVSSYEHRKRARSLLDFDDLIERLAALLEDERVRDWVKYKLDKGVTHILVDESQDTNPEQWRVIEALTGEFFVGDSAAERHRTVFAVGDEKQSIYSFQGADPILFGQTGERLQVAAGIVGKPFRQMRLPASFRTLPAILEAVDRVFARPGLATALLAPETGTEHETARADPGGSVTLWPPIQAGNDKPQAGEWPLHPADDIRTAPRRLAEALAATIRGWIGTKRPFGSRPRAVEAGDVLILVQSRGALFKEIIRALKNSGVPTPGADQLPVSGHIAIRDLLALGDVLLNPDDDLTLSALLRSPLFGFDEDQLFTLCHNRDGSVWDALAGAAKTRDWALTAFERLKTWRDRLDFERPYEFFARVLYADGGLKRLHARLGSEIDDVVGAFLNLALEHEQAGPPSLLGFLVAMRHRDGSVKRELSGGGAGVRVMTVHGAKGLEAPIVILADAASKPSGKQLAEPLYLGDADTGPLLVHAGRVEDHLPQTIGLRDASIKSQQAEYWRKLYVGMTRAEDELYLTGPLAVNGKVDDTWYGEVAAALEGHTAPLPPFESDGPDGLVFPACPHRPAPLAPAHKSAQAAFELPGTAPLAIPQMRETVRPSAVGHPDRGPGPELETAAGAVRDAGQARRSGLALHALLQHLPLLAPAGRSRAANRALETLLPEEPAAHPALVRTAMEILATPEFSAIFGSGSRAEVPFLAKAVRDARPVQIAGRIDRLVVRPDCVLAIDFKSDAVPPASPGAVTGAYLTQMGLYARVAKALFPGFKVRAAILWTATRTLMELPHEKLMAAAKGFTIE